MIVSPFLDSVEPPVSGAVSSVGGSVSVGIALFLHRSWRRVFLTVGSLFVLADSVFPGAAS